MSVTGAVDTPLISSGTLDYGVFCLFSIHSVIENTLRSQLVAVKRFCKTGAGDAFLAGLMYGLYHGYPFADCVRFGNITGGKSVTGVGCLTEYVQESELLALREKYKDL